MSFIAADILAAVWQYIVIGALAIFSYFLLKSKSNQKQKFKNEIQQQISENIKIKQDLAVKEKSLNKLEKVSEIEKNILHNRSDALDRLHNEWSRDGKED